MPDKTYLLQFKAPELPVRTIIAATAEIHGEHLVLLNSQGQLAAMFVLDMLESWNEFNVQPSCLDLGHQCEKEG